MDVELRVGHGSEPTTTQGPLINVRAAEKVLHMNIKYSLRMPTHSYIIKNVHTRRVQKNGAYQLLFVVGGEPDC